MLNTILLFGSGIWIGIGIGATLAIRRSKKDLYDSEKKILFWYDQYCGLVKRLDDQDTNCPNYYPEKEQE